MSHRLAHRALSLLVVLLVVSLLPSVPPAPTVRAAAASVPFRPPLDVTNTPGGTFNMALGDLNGDGSLDLVLNYYVGTSQIGTSQVYLNNGTGTFAATGAALPSANSIALGDINGDGKLDIILGSSGAARQSEIYLNNGTGGFPTLPSSTLNPVGNTTTSVALGDLNGDGKLDILLGNAGVTNNCIPNCTYESSQVYVNNGTGGFTAPPLTINPTGNATTSVALGDINGDGKLDIVLGNGTNNCNPNCTYESSQVYVNNGTGGFTAPPLTLNPTGNDTRSVAMGDLNGDGKLDIVLGNNGQPSQVYLNGTGGFTAPPLTLNPASNATRGVALGDLNGDGTLDILLGNNYEPSQIYLNNGKGSFTAAASPLNPGGITTKCVALGDLNADGTVDILLGNSLETSQVYLNDSKGSAIVPSLPPATFKLPLYLNQTKTLTTSSVALGDLNGDGSLDLVLGSSGGLPSQVYLNDGHGGYTATAAPINPGGNRTLSVALGDFNGDGSLDLVLGNDWEDSQVYLNDGRGNFTPTASPLGGNDTHSVAVGDLDGNGTLDILLSEYSGWSQVYLNDGKGNFTPTASPVNPVINFTQSVALGDLNGDGSLDLVLGNDGESSQVYLNDGLGNFTPTVTPLNAANPTRSVALGDLNGDGNLDILLGNYRQPSQVYLNDGHGGFSAIAPITLNPAGNFTTSASLGDINGDGTVDILLGNDGPSQVYLNDGKASFTTTSTALNPDGNHTQSVVLGDLNGDGALDIMLGNLIYLNDGQRNFTPSAAPINPAATSRTRSVALGDLNGDGNLDVLLGNFGQPSQVYLNSGQGSFTATVAPINSSVGNATYSVALGDLNGDGSLDIILGNYGEPSQVYLNDGLGNFTPTISSLNPGGNATTSVALGDLDNNGSLDLVLGNSGQPSRVYLNDGLGNITPAASPLNPGGSTTTSVALGDINGDGSLDILLGNNGPSRIYLNDGHGNFTPTAASFNPGGNATQSVALGDINGDGALDLVLGNYGEPSQVYLNLNDGQGRFTPMTAPVNPAGNYAYGVALGDFNGDGALDIVLGSNGQPSRVYLNDGHGNVTPTAASLNPIGNATQSVAMGDINGDGSVDILLGNNGPSRVYLNHVDTSAQLPNNPSAVIVARPVRTSAAGFYSTPEILGTSPILIPYALTDVEGDPVREVRAEYSLDGGGKWRPAVAASVPLTTTSGTALRFDGLDDRAVVPNVTGLAPGNTPHTIEAWVRVSALPVYRSWPLVLGNVTNGSHHWLIGSNGVAQIGVYGATPQQVNPTLPVGVWTHLAAAFDGTTLRVYQNGNLVGSVAASFNLQGLPLTLGWAGLESAFAGAMDDVRIWNTARTQAQIQTTMHRTLSGNEPGLVGYWRFDDRSGITAANSVPGGIAGDLGAGIVVQRPTWTNGAPIAQPHTFAWDTAKSNFFGQSDNVVVRLTAIPLGTTGPHGVPVFQHPFASSTTLPFRVRGTQVRVVDPQNVPQSGAVVYRLNDTLSRDQQLFAASTTAQAYTTNALGYLGGRGELSPSDQLIALAPMALTGAYTNAYSPTVRLYATNIITTPDGIRGTPVTPSGVQVVTVSSAHPLALFDLNLSLEWDARYDARFMLQLQTDLARASELLFQASHGQAALGNVAIFHDKENWDTADIRIYASNRVRPSALIGGVATHVITDPTTLSTVIYGPGQVHMGAVWNRFGSATGNLSEDWPRTLAHELGHYLFFLEDNYVGIANGQVVPVTSCPGLMADSYAALWQFQTRASWTNPNNTPIACEPTFSNQTTGRADWETIHTFYPALVPPTQPLNTLPPGPIHLPLATTEITSVVPLTTTERLSVPIFYTVNVTGERTLSALTARAYLFQHSHHTPDTTYTQLVPLGRANNDQVQARGARIGDRLCLFEPTTARFGCETITAGREYLTLNQRPTWQPDIQITPVTSRTLEVRVTGVPPGTNNLIGNLYPLDDDPLTTPATIANDGSGTYRGTFTLKYPLPGAYIHLATTDTVNGKPIWETVTSYALDGNAGSYSRVGAGSSNSRVGAGSSNSRVGAGSSNSRVGAGSSNSRVGAGSSNSRVGAGSSFMRVGGAPISSAEGDVQLVGDNLTFTSGQFLLLQTTSSLPTLPPWATLIGQGYRFTTSPNAPTLTGNSLSFSYLDAEVPAGEESGIQVYYRSPTATTWTPITTTLDIYINLASVPMQGPGLYALMSSVEVPIAGPGWSIFAYPVAGQRPVANALAGIAGQYTAIYGYDLADTADHWKLYSPTTVAWNDLTTLEYGHGYWIDSTAVITLPLHGALMAQSQSTRPQSIMPAPPMTIYAVVDGQSPVPGQVVTATIGGVRCAETTTRAVGEQVVYALDVPTTSEQRGCGTPGALVDVTLNGQRVGQVSWASGPQPLGVGGEPNRVLLPLVYR